MQAAVAAAAVAPAHKPASAPAADLPSNVQEAATVHMLSSELG